MSSNTTYYYNILQITTCIEPVCAICQITTYYYEIQTCENIWGGGAQPPPIYFHRSVFRSNSKYFVVIEEYSELNKEGL